MYTGIALSLEKRSINTLGENMPVPNESRFIERIPRRAGDVPIGIVLELEAERAMRIVGRRFIAQRDVFLRHELGVAPFAVVQQAVTKTGCIGRMQGDASGSVRVRHVVISTVQAVAPCAPAHGLRQPLANVILQFHSRDMPQHDRGDVRRLS